MRCSVMLLVALSVATVLPSPALAQQPATFYEENCASCHTIGQGVQGGPDLKGVTTRRDREWLIRFLLDPDAFATDPAVVQMIKEADGLAMGPTEGLTRELAEALLVHIEQQSADPGAPSAAEGFAPFTADEVALGRALFSGRTRLSAGGPACASCHRAADLPAFSGGRLGPDLMDVHQRLGGGRGVTAWMGTTQSPMMRALYRDSRITPDEARALAAFMEVRPAEPRPVGATPPHVLGGLAGGLLVVAIVGAAGARRFRAVRRTLVDGYRTHDAVRTR